MKIMIVTVKSWNIERAQALKERYMAVHHIVIYTAKEEFTIDNVRKVDPDYIFLTHWSYFIPDEITNNWKCIVFHMTDLPYGRGGSPLQNLIVRGHKETKISAIKVTGTLDGGPVYMKRPLSLEGSAREIYVRCSDVIYNEMIPVFLTREIEPVPQEGVPVIFKRRKPEDGKITPDMELNKIYDYIRMLDAEGYPRAYMEFGGYRLEFEGAEVSADGQELSARVLFRKDGE
ncbi:MAG: methionyl-tRNA formyltransferase [bacterium]|nr:methionyl-tRNA formyltransferase [bacterium]